MLRKPLLWLLNSTVELAERLIQQISPTTYFIGDQEINEQLYEKAKRKLQDEVNNTQEEEKDAGTCSSIEVFFMLSNNAAKYTYDIVRRERRVALDFSPSFVIVQCRENGKVIRVDEDAFHLFFTTDRKQAVFNMRA